jgi:exodeoxyribonuclease VII large subunit
MVGIGHDKDVPLVSLVADRAASTPTAVAKSLNFSWEQALSKVRLAEQKIFSKFGTALYENRESLTRLYGIIENRFRGLLERFRAAEERLQRSAISIGNALTRYREILARFGKTLPEKLGQDIRHEKERLVHAWKMIEANNPERQLKLGYSIATVNGKVVRSVKDVEKGDEVDIKVEDGKISTIIK